MTLAELPTDQPARIQSVAGDYSIALLELGMVPGAPVTILRRAPFGDPLEVDLGGARLAIRSAAAAAVRVDALSA